VVDIHPTVRQEANLLLTDRFPDILQSALDRVVQANESSLTLSKARVLVDRQLQPHIQVSLMRPTLSIVFLLFDVRFTFSARQALQSQLIVSLSRSPLLVSFRPCVFCSLSRRFEGQISASIFPDELDRTRPTHHLEVQLESDPTTVDKQRNRTSSAGFRFLRSDLERVRTKVRVHERSSSFVFSIALSQHYISPNCRRRTLLARHASTTVFGSSARIHRQLIRFDRRHSRQLPAPAALS
jgi:hypothetical protein